MHCTRVLTLLALLVGLVHSFKWDIVVGGNKALEFYYNGTLTHKEPLPWTYAITSVIYDQVHSRLLFANNNPNMSVYSFDRFDQPSRKINHLFTIETYDYATRIAYDPITQVVFWIDGNGVYSFSINPELPNEAADGHLLARLSSWANDIAVDSCGGYIYWTKVEGIERARFDGSEREVIVDNYAYERKSLAIDHRTQKIYWTETIDRLDSGVYWITIESANFDGKNRSALYNIFEKTSFSHSLAVSKDFFYWQNFDQQNIWQLPKNLSQRVARNFYALPCDNCWAYHRLTTNYKIRDQIQGAKNCSALRRLISNNLNNSNPDCAVSVCQNYCFQGDCSVNAEGEATCSCKAGYSGDRCEVNTCQDYCLNGGVCSLNEVNKRVCQCTADYEGERCNVPKFLTKCIQAVSILKDILKTDVTSVTLDKGVKSTCASSVV